MGEVLVFLFLHLMNAQSILASSSVPSAISSKEYVLPAAGTLLLPLPSHHRVVVGDGKLLRVRVHKSKVQVIGAKVGSSSLILGSEHYLIHVLRPMDYELYQQLLPSLKTMLGPKATLTQGRIVITGEILRFDDYKELCALARAGGTFQLNAKVDPDIEPSVLDFLRTEQLRGGLAPLPISLSPRALATLSEAHQELLTQYQTLLQPLGVDVLVSKKAVELEPLVRVKILVAEVRQQALQRLGLQWPGETKATLIDPRVNQLGELKFSGLEWALHTLEVEGKSHILASPTLLTRSGESAEFLAGGEFPIRMSFRGNLDVKWKQHGIILKIKPKADHFGRMSIFVQTEVSLMDSSQTVEGIPGLLINRLQSHLDLEKSQTIALSGLIKNDWGTVRTGLPELLKIPILGRLFSSNDYRSQKTELVIFVTPEIFNKFENPNKLLPKDLKNED